MKKKTVVVIFGGQSSEHEVSCMSAINIINHINQQIYDTLLIGITREGHWLLVPNLELIQSGQWRDGREEAVILPDASKKSVQITKGDKVTLVKVDVVFPVLHGLFGEDGTIQGLLELAQIPYVGCGVLASALSMDKVYTKQLAKLLGIRQADYVCLMSKSEAAVEQGIGEIEEKLPYPVFVKPANAGSSCGVTKAYDKESLRKGITAAFAHDSKVLVEETIIGREVECAVLGGSSARASGVGEILAAADFYDYDAKYHNEASATILDPDIPEEAVREIRETSVRIFHEVGGFGLARVDFFVRQDTNEVVFNEINTMPGFTVISMYPELWEHKGISKTVLIEKLLQAAFKRKEQ